MYRQIFLVALFIGLLNSCQSSVVKNEASGYRVPAGSTIIVHQDIQLIAGKSKAIIQGGRLVETLEFGDLFFPHCIFEVGKGVLMTRLIKAGNYRVEMFIILTEVVCLDFMFIILTEVVCLDFCALGPTSWSSTRSCSWTGPGSGRRVLVLLLSR